MNAYSFLRHTIFGFGGALLLAVTSCDNSEGRVGAMYNSSTGNPDELGDSGNPGNEAGACPAPQPPPPDTNCIQAHAWARDPETQTCCLYPTPCNAPTGWQTFFSEDDCRSAAACPAPRPELPGDVCLQAEIWARDPETKACCGYPHSCAVPRGWDYFPNEEECRTAAVCPAPRPQAPDTVCPQVNVWVRDPETKACCGYGTPCFAPIGWEYFFNEADCKAP